MQRTSRSRTAASLLAALLVAFSAFGCGENAPVEKYIPVDYDAGILDQGCVDEDGDGYGKGCAAGPDCDDDDADVTDLCIRCSVPATGCPCDPGTEAVACVPPPYRGTDASGVSGTYKCSDGTRYCALGEWGACQALTAYVFEPDS